MRYFVIDSERLDHRAFISDIPKSMPRPYRFIKGVSLTKEWGDVSFSFAKAYKDGIELADSVGNSISLFIVSKKIKQLIVPTVQVGLEFLPAKILNHNGRLASDAYFAVNFLHLTQVIDKIKSEFEMSESFPDRIFSFRKLRLLEGIRKNGPALLRPQEKPDMLLVREDLKVAMENAHVTGLTYTDTMKFSSYTPS